MMKSIKLFLILILLLITFAPAIYAGSITEYNETYGEVEFTETGESFIFKRSSGRITKVDKAGSVVWSNDYFSYDMVDPSLQLPLNINILRDTGNGGCIIEGLTKADPAQKFSRPHRLLMKINNDGTVAWLNRYENSIATHSYTFPWFGATDIIKAQGDEGYLLAGTYVRDLGNSWSYLLKLDSTGNIEWQKKYFNRVNVNIAQGSGGRIVQLADGGYVLSFGGSGLGGSSRHRIVYKVDSSGIIQWQKKFTHPTNGGIATDSGWKSRILATDDRGCIILASYGQDVFITKLDTDTGELLWMKNIKSTSQVQINSDLNDGLLVAYRPSNTIYSKFNLMNLDQNGDFIWAKSIELSTTFYNLFPVVSVDDNVKIGLHSKESRLPILLNMDNVFETNECVTMTSLASPLTDNQLNLIDSNFVTAEHLKDYWGTKESFSVTSLDEPSHIISSDLVSAEIICATNEPPVAHAGNDMDMECASSIGTDITLDGSASFDTDGDSLTYTWDGPFGTVAGKSPLVTLPLGDHGITLTVDDGKGGTDSDQVIISVVDTSPPSISTVFSGVSGNNGWYVSPVTIRLIASDNCCGVESLYYNLNSVSQTIAGASANIDLSEGINDTSYYAVDKAGNAGIPAQLTVNIDLTTPIININGINDGAIYPVCKTPTPSYDTLDNLSGVASSSANTSQNTQTGIVSYTYSVTASDIAGNQASAEVSYGVIEDCRGLIDLVLQYVATGQIASQMENSLLAQLKDCRKLGAFINHVQAQSGKKIDPAAADMLVNSALCLSN
ncbi:MAG: hypothetical protein ABFS18_12160 [Thermodesulfobacteriota bacterium]